ncbi:unnamed protein product [Closterium sp. NIES-54]
MAEHIDVTMLTHDRLNELLQQLRESFEEIAALTAERMSLQNGVARAQQTQAQAQGTSGQPAPQASQHGSVGKPASVASDGVVRNDGDDDHGTTHPEATNAARSQPRVTISVPQYRTWDAWCAGLCARFEPIAASIAARQKLRTWRQLGSVQDYTSGFLVLCEQVGYMHESERIDRYIGGLKHEIAQEIQLRGVTDFQEILAMVEKLYFFRRPRPGSYGSSSNWGHRSRGTNEGATIRAVAANAASTPFKGRYFMCNQPGHRKSVCLEIAKGKGEAEEQKQTKQQGNAGSQ